MARHAWAIWLIVASKPRVGSLLESGVTLMPGRPRRVILALLSSAVILGPAFGQIGSAGVDSQPVGSAQLGGRIVASDNLAPVKRAFVRLSGMADSLQGTAPPREPVTRQVETDDNGRFDFANLPGGSYHLTIEPQHGFVRPSRPRDATLADGQTVDVTVPLERTGAIAGHIVDENGDSVLGAQVQALRRNDFDLHVTPVGFTSPATTDDLGQFRLFNLPPGEYYVVATYTPPHRDPDAAARTGYATTYYPGSRVLQDGWRVLVRAGQDTSSIDRSPRAHEASTARGAGHAQPRPEGRGVFASHTHHTVRRST